MEQLLDVDGLLVRWRNGADIRVPALGLQAGEVAALHGPSGCGKTTALSAMFGLLDGEATVTGSVRWRGQQVLQMPPAQRRKLRRHEVSILAQDAASALDPLQPVGRQIAQATHCPDSECVSMLEELGVVDAAALARRLPHEVSGGEAQRALLAIAFLRAPALVVADEPSASLDAGAGAELRAQLRSLVERGTALLLATHDEQLLRDLGAQVATFRDGSFVPGEPASAPWPAPEAGGGDVGTVPVLALRSVNTSFAGRPVLVDASLELRRGEIVAIVGASGAGKTTLARLLAGHLRPDAGTVERPARGGAVQLLCQNAFGSLTPGRTLRSLALETAGATDVTATAASLSLPADVLDRTPMQMSGGERRRAALLRALLARPDVLVLDEPTASLDRATGIHVVETLLRVRRERGLSLVLITHDLELARTTAHRVVTVEGGRLCPS